jgi:hypothetical protein
VFFLCSIVFAFWLQCDVERFITGHVYLGFYMPSVLGCPYPLCTFKFVLLIRSQSSWKFIWFLLLLPTCTISSTLSSMYNILSSAWSNQLVMQSIVFYLFYCIHHFQMVFVFRISISRLNFLLILISHLHLEWTSLLHSAICVNSLSCNWSVLYIDYWILCIIFQSFQYLLIWLLRNYEHWMSYAALLYYISYGSTLWFIYSLV